jgi:hypothetical protein
MSIPSQPITSPGDGARRSLRYARRMLARRLGALQVSTTSGDGKADGSTLVATSLANQFDSDRYRGWWAMPTDGLSAGAVRTIGTDALAAVTGELTVAPKFPTQILRGVQVELHKMLPPDDQDGYMGLRACLNLALGECWVIDRHAFTTISQSQVWDLSAFGDWMDPQAVVEVYSPPLTTDSNVVVPFGGFQGRQSLDQMLVDVSPGWSTGWTAGVELTRPADTYMKQSGAWVNTNGGFQVDADESLIQPQFLVELALKHAYRALSMQSSGAEKAQYTALADAQERKTELAKWTGLPHPAERLNHPAGMNGPSNWWEFVR